MLRWAGFLDDASFTWGGCNRDRVLIYVRITGLMGLGILAVDWSLEEVEGKDKKEGGGDPVEAHEQQHPLLVAPEKAGFFAKGAESAPFLFALAHQWLLHFVVYYKSPTSYPLSCSISPIHYKIPNKQLIAISKLVQINTPRGIIASTFWWLFL
jgi:hypothetical protein